jgi:hypothetical protein
MAEKSSFGTGGNNLAWRNRKKIRQIINAYIYLPFFLLIILYTKIPIPVLDKITECLMTEKKDKEPMTSK